VNLHLIIGLLTLLLVGMKKFLFYAVLFGLILLLSTVLDKYWNETNDIGYLPSLGLTCLIVFTKEYLIPIIKSK
ncbi:uncharacterized protein METZ01_LOCUS43085, partial [marine metagenome]